MYIQEKGREEADRKVRSHTPSLVPQIHLLVSLVFFTISFVTEKEWINLILYLLVSSFSFGKAVILSYFYLPSFHLFWLHIWQNTLPPL